MRNYDLATALQVLTNGYPTLPGRLIDQFDSKPKLSDSEVIKIMQDLNELIRYRLASCEVIPKEFRSYRICSSNHSASFFFSLADGLFLAGGIIHVPTNFQKKVTEESSSKSIECLNVASP
jgi:hypothetical protein